jgi:outer membrane protein assembly factor BamB
MNARRVAFVSWIAFLWINPTFAQWQTPRSSRASITAASLRKVGLQRAWRTRVAVDSSRGSLVSIVSYLDTTHWSSAYDVSYDGGQTSFDERQLDRFGQPIGPQRAEHLADLERRILATRNIEAQVTARRIPQIALYAQTTEAILHAIDAETGRTKWTVSAGVPRYPSLSPGANDRYVAIINGSTLYLFDTTEEKIAWQKSLGVAPGAGPVLTLDTCYVPLLNGIVQGFALESGKRVVRWRSVGRPMVQPVATPESLIWPTDRGYLYVVDKSLHEMRFRLESGSEIVGNAAHRAPHQAIVSTSDGHAYSVNELTGEIMWRFSAGDPIVSAPVVIGDRAYVITVGREISCIDAEIGSLVWSARGVENFLAAGKDRVFVQGPRSELIALDRQSGARLAWINTGFDFHIPNAINDRIYVGTKSGLLVCLRAPGQEQPLMHVELPQPAEEDATSADAPAAGLDVSPDDGTAPDTTPTDEVDPLDDEDPFGVDGADGEDPFAVDSPF